MPDLDEVHSKLPPNLGVAVLVVKEDHVLVGNGPAARTRVRRAVPVEFAEVRDLRAGVDLGKVEQGGGFAFPPGCGRRAARSLRVGV